MFIFDGSNWAQRAFLKATDPGQFSFFGVAVAIGGGTVVVGAPGAVAGKAYAFH